MLKSIGIEDHFIIKRQHRRLAATDMFDVVVASFTENIRKNNRPLNGIHNIFAQIFLPIGPLLNMLIIGLFFHKYSQSALAGPVQHELQLVA
jgi:hypothetical protein